MENLRKLRLKKGYSQLQLASFFKVGASVVARWEKGQSSPSLPQIIKLCRILNCRPYELYSCCTDNNDCVAIPVFDGKKVYPEHISDSILPDADFGIVLHNDITERLCAGDVCYFTICKRAETDSIVMTDDYLYDYKIVTMSDEHKNNVAAVCTAVHCQI